MKRIAAALLALALALPAAARAQEVITYPFDGSYDDATFALENAIVNRGLVVDYTSHVGNMLERTRADVGGKKIFDDAQAYLFCSAQLSRKMMEADPMNIAFCPYSLFAADVEGDVVIGYRTYPDGPMQEVQALLDSIAREATGN